jgi:hypothetical protein
MQDNELQVVAEALDYLLGQRMSRLISEAGRSPTADDETAHVGDLLLKVRSLRTNPDYTVVVSPREVFDQTTGRWRPDTTP